MYPDDDDGVGGGGGGGGGIDGGSSDDGYDTSNMMDWGIRRKEKTALRRLLLALPFFVMFNVYVLRVLPIRARCTRTFRFSYYCFSQSYFAFKNIFNVFCGREMCSSRRIVIVHPRNRYCYMMVYCVYLFSWRAFLRVI